MLTNTETNFNGILENSFICAMPLLKWHKRLYFYRKLFKQQSMTLNTYLQVGEKLFKDPF